MSKSNVVLIPAIVQLTSPDRGEYKPYKTELTFDGKVIVEVPVPASEVNQQGGKFVLTLKGWTTFLDAYTTAVEMMDEGYKRDLRTGQVHRPHEINR